MEHEEEKPRVTAKVSRFPRRVATTSRTMKTTVRPLVAGVQQYTLPWQGSASIGAGQVGGASDHYLEVARQSQMLDKVLQRSST